MVCVGLERRKAVDEVGTGLTRVCSLEVQPKASARPALEEGGWQSGRGGRACHQELPPLSLRVTRWARGPVGSS